MRRLLNPSSTIARDHLHTSGRRRPSTRADPTPDHRFASAATMGHDGPVRARTTDSDGVWAPGRRALTLGLVFTITLVGFEGLAIATILKVIDDDLGDIGVLGWVFSAFFLGSLFGVVAAGRDAGRNGPARSAD